MDSKTRTRILYEDPNSIFKANKRVYLHELQGSTLRSKQPLPNDIDAGLKTSELMVKIIKSMSSLQSIIDYFYSMVELEGQRLGSNSVSQQYIKEGSSLIGTIQGVIKQLLKSPQNSFSEDDIFTILQAYQDMNEKIQYMIEAINDLDRRPILEPFFLSSTFENFYKKLKSLFSALDQLVPYANVSGISIPDINGIQPYEQLDEAEVQDDEFQDAVEPPELDGAGRRPRLLRGSGRYKVLSDRAHVIQSQPYKRFL